MIWTRKRVNMGLNLGSFGNNWAILALRIPMNFCGILMSLHFYYRISGDLLEKNYGILCELPVKSVKNGYFGIVVESS